MTTERRRPRRRRLLTRGVPLLLLAAAAFSAGVLVGSPSAAERHIERFASAWEADDHVAMHAELSAAARREYPLRRFDEAYRPLERAAGLRSVEVSDPTGAGGGIYRVEVVYDTRSFGKLGGTIELPVGDDGIDWDPHLTFPTLAPTERIALRGGSPPARAPILASDGTELAAGPDRSSEIGPAAQSVTGELGSPSPEQEQSLADRGFPAGTPVGISGLELAFEDQLAGLPGSSLVATDRESGETRTVARRKPAEGKPLRTTIDPQLQGATVAALGGQFGGVAVLDAVTGEVRALAGLAFSAPQPPGSTFKIITASAALEEGITTPQEEFPVLVSTDAGGRELANAHEEACGGTFVRSFALSCNTVFGPLGVELGAGKLISYAEAFGFNSDPTLYDRSAVELAGIPQSTIPAEIESPVEVGVSAIGQGRVLATPLSVASWAQTIASGGLRQPTNLVRNKALRAEAEPVRAISRPTSRELKAMMVEVVETGTGEAADLSSVQVAGKTGTAELRPKEPEPLQEGEEPPDPDEPPEQEVDAWFAAYAPADKPKLALAVMIVNADGDGGEIAAPIARQILESVFGP